MQDVSKLINRQTIFELAAPIFLQRFFADFYGSESVFTSTCFQLQIRPFGLKTECFNSILRYEIRSAKIYLS